jgi:GR25 family glycosyltransferase involved in LPS biosynthesis
MSSPAIPHAYCINLRRRPDRWRRMRDRFRRRGMNVERFLATDGAGIDLDTLSPSLVVQEYDTTRNARWDRSVAPGHRARLSVGEVGCILSHLAVWDDFVERDVPWAVVVEDDVDFQPGFAERVVALVSQLPAWDLCYLGYINTGPPPAPVGPGFGRPVYLFGTWAYLVSRAGAERLLELLPVDEPIDNFLAAHFPDLDVYCAVPPLVRPQRQAMQDSNILHTARLAGRLKHA